MNQFQKQFENETRREAYYPFEGYNYKYVKWLEKNLEVTNKLLKSRQQLLDEIPECPQHGKCVPHALEWIEEMKNLRLPQT